MTDSSRTVPLVNLDGEVKQVPAENAEKALQLGFTKPSAEQLHSAVNERFYGGTGGAIESAVLGSQRGATLGLSDLAYKTSGVAPSETLRSIKEANPTASTVGEVGGAIGGALAGGAPSGLVSELGGAATEATGGLLSGLAARGLAGRVVAKGISSAAGGALEGAIYGAANTVDESVLGDTELNAEKVLAGAGWGAVMGGTAGGILGGGLELGGEIAKRAASKVADKLGEGGVADWLRGFAKDRALKATLGQQKKAFVQLEDKGDIDAAGAYVVDNILPNIKSHTNEAIADALAAKRQDIGEQLGAVIKTVDEATADQPLQRLSYRQIANRIESDPEIAKLRDLVGERHTYAAIEDEIQALRDKGNAAMSFADAVKERASIQGKVNYDVINGLNSSAAAKNRIAQIWNDAIDEHVEPVLGSLGYPEAQGAYRALRNEYRLVTRLSDYAANRVAGNKAVRFISPSDYGFGAAGGLAAAASGEAGAVGASARGLAEAVVHKIVRERGNAVLADMADRASRLRILQGVGQDVGDRIEQAVDSLISRGSEVAPALVLPATRALQDTSLAAPLKRAAENDRRKAYMDRVAELQSLTGDPAGAANNLGASLRHVSNAAPKLSMAIGAKASTAAQFLLSKAPKNPNPPSPLEPGKKWAPSDAEMARWARYYAAVNDPVSVLDGLKHGHVTREGVETLQAVYPKLYADMQKQLIGRVAELKTSLPRSDRIALSVLFGVPLDATMRPDFVGAMQSQYAQQQQPPQQGESGGHDEPSKLAEATKTHSQRVLER